MEDINDVAKRLIAKSVVTNSIVDLENNSELISTLIAWSEDYELWRRDDGGIVLEIWGTDDSDAPWRVRLSAKPGESVEYDVNL